MCSKRIMQSDITGHEGVLLIDRIVTAMGFIWRETPWADAGIDGEIEIRDSKTGEMTNCIIKVQSKATKNPFQSETEDSFSYTCSKDDLEYWRYGNTPVILIVSRPREDLAYWIDIKEYFGSEDSGLTVRFDKTQHVLEATDKCKLQLQDLAKPKDSGLYFNPPQVTEKLISNFLPVSSFGTKIYLAETSFRDHRDIFEVFRESGCIVSGEWFLKDKFIYSFHNLRETPWDQIVDIGTCEYIGSDEWSDSDDNDMVNNFSRLLKLALKEKLYPKVSYYRRGKTELFYVAPSKNLKSVIWSYPSSKKQSKRTVFRDYRNKKNTEKVSYYRHNAFEAQFRRFDNNWFLELNPTYFYTVDGREKHRRSHELLKRIKELEQNKSVCGQFLMWAHRLADQDDLFDKPYPYLSFGSPLTFECPVGIIDDVWLTKDEVIDKESVAHADESWLLPEDGDF